MNVDLDNQGRQLDVGKGGGGVELANYLSEHVTSTKISFFKVKITKSDLDKLLLFRDLRS